MDSNEDRPTDPPTQAPMTAEERVNQYACTIDISTGPVRVIAAGTAAGLMEEHARQAVEAELEVRGRATQVLLNGALARAEKAERALAEKQAWIDEYHDHAAKLSAKLAEARKWLRVAIEHADEVDDHEDDRCRVWDEDHDGVLLRDIVEKFLAAPSAAEPGEGNDAE